MENRVGKGEIELWPVDAKVSVPYPGVWAGKPRVEGGRGRGRANQRRGGLEDVNDDECDVILLWQGRGLPEANFREQLINQFGGRARLIAANHLFESGVTKGLAAGIFGLNDAIGVKEKAVTRVDGNIADGIVGVGKDSENDAIAGNALELISA